MLFSCHLNVQISSFWFFWININYSKLYKPYNILNKNTCKFRIYGFTLNILNRYFGSSHSYLCLSTWVIVFWYWMVFIFNVGDSSKSEHVTTSFLIAGSFSMLCMTTFLRNYCPKNCAEMLLLYYFSCTVICMTLKNKCMEPNLFTDWNIMICISRQEMASFLNKFYL